MLIKGLVKNPVEKKFINNQMMCLYSNVEQVGFYDFNSEINMATLEMAGGEFCGNALRSLAYLILNGKNGEITAQVSGTNQILIAGVKKNEAYAQMPILKNLNSIRNLTNNLSLVKLEGIAYLITEKPIGLTSQELKKISKGLLKETGLLYSEPAAGVIFVTKDRTNLSIDPVVWVRDLKTLFYETACASGTAAVGLYQANKSLFSYTKLRIKQPSGHYISVSVNKNKHSFISTQIWGVVEIINQGNIALEASKL